MEVTIVQYKESEIGVIPVDWEVKKLQEISDLATGNTPPTNDPTNYGDEFLFVSPADLGKGKWITQTEKKLSKKGFSISRKFPKNSILFTCIGSTIGKSGMAQLELTSNQQINAVIPSSKYANEFIFYALDYISPRIKLLAGEQAVPIVNKTSFGETLLAVPPTKSEQTAIATALSDTDALIENLEKLIAKKRNIKQCIMHKLLMPKNYWETRKIKEIVSTPVTDGPHETPKFLKEGVPFLSVNNLVNNRIDFNELRFISLEDHLLYSRKCKPQKNDILLGKAASVGKVAILNTDLEINIWSPIALIRPKNTFVPYFIYYYFQTSQILNQIEFFTNSSSQGNIGMGDIEKIEICYPPFDEQVQIAQLLTDIDSELSALDQKLQKYTMIKQGMMQALLTGKIRLI